jgi:hypothetical protein
VHQGEPSLAGPPDSHPSWLPQAMGVLSEIDGRAPCYPAFFQVMPLREWHRDGVNRDLLLRLPLVPEQILTH